MKVHTAIFFIQLGMYFQSVMYIEATKFSPSPTCATRTCIFVRNAAFLRPSDKDLLHYVIPTMLVCPVKPYPFL